ncbi:MAG: hypothetical protein ABEI77_00605 [Halorientalis sp.]
MADEFAKGFGILVSAGLGWIVLAGWYTTDSFESGQLFGTPPKNPDIYGQMALILKDVLFWFAVLGALTFWVIIPGINQARASLAERSS